MSQEEMVGDLGESVGYVLKQAATSLHVAMDAVLRPLGLTVSQYSCLELLSRTPDQSNADLARGAFVTRQSMNEVLRGLQTRGLVDRPDKATHGRSLPTRLTTAGRRVLTDASVAVARVERQMLSSLTPFDRTRLLGDLRACMDALAPDGAVGD